MSAKAIIKRIKTGKKAGQFRFTLKGKNGENLSPQETYTQKHNVIEVITEYFPEFEIIDTTKKK